MILNTQQNYNHYIYITQYKLLHVYNLYNAFMWIDMQLLTNSNLSYITEGRVIDDWGAEEIQESS